VAAGAPRTTRKKKNNNMLKVIFDTDPGVDDALALLYLHKHAQIDLIGVTTTFGNASVESTTHNALYLKQAWGFAAPVARGAGGPLQPEATPEAWPVHIHGQNGLGNHPVPASLDVAADARPAHQLIIDLVRAHPGEVTLVAVGRMTNLALALQQAPDIAGLVRGVVIMGGAFHVNGNITPAAEANIWGDAEAADVVFTASWPVTAIGLDVTTRVEMDRDGLDTLAAIGGADAELVRALSQDYVDFYLQAGHKGMVVHDCCACAAPPGAVPVRARQRARGHRRCRPRHDHSQAGRPGVRSQRVGWPRGAVDCHRRGCGRGTGRHRADPEGLTR